MVHISVFTLYIKIKGEKRAQAAGKEARAGARGSEEAEAFT